MFKFSKKARTIFVAIMSIFFIGTLSNCVLWDSKKETATNQSLFNKHIQLPNELASATITRGTSAESSALAQQISTLWDQANAAYTAENYTQAVDVLKQIENLDAAFETQSESSFYHALGSAQLKQGNAEAAQRSFAKVTSGELSEDAVWKRALSLLAIDEQTDNATAAMQSIANSSHAKSTLAQNIMSEMSNMAAGGLNPKVNVVGGVVEGVIPFTVNVNSNGTTSSNPIISHLWNLGDGTTASNVTSLEHTYYKPGIYTISVLIFDLTGQGATAEVQVAVSAPIGNYEFAIPIEQDVTIQSGTVMNEPTLQAGPNKTTYLKCNTEEVFGTITKTELEMSYEGITSTSGQVQVHKGSTTLWSEGTINSGNAPTKGALLDEVNRSFQLGTLVRWNMQTTAKEEFTAILSTPSSTTFTFGASEYYFDDGKPKLVLQVDNSAGLGQFSLSPPAPPAEPMYFEAECATAVGNNWKANAKGTASNGIALLYPGTMQVFNSPPTQADQRVRFVFYTAQEATYDVFTRILVKNAQNNAFWVRINSNPWIKFSDIPRKASFKWEHVFDNNNGGATVTYTFSPGTHTIDVAVMEDGTLFDKLALIPAGSGAPNGVGPNATNCAGGNSSDSGSNAMPLSSGKTATATSVYAFDYEEKKNLTEDIEIYPNPFFSEVTLDMHIPDEQVDVRVFDLSGKLVNEYLGINADQRLTIGNELSNGNYIVHVDAGNDIFYKKIQKIAE